MTNRKAGIFGRSRGHLRDAGEGYFHHLRVASGIGATMISAGATCVLHGLLPGVFTNRASGTIRRLNDKIASRHDAALKQALTQLEYEI